MSIRKLYICTLNGLKYGHLPLFIAVMAQFVMGTYFLINFSTFKSIDETVLLYYYVSQIVMTMASCNLASFLLSNIKKGVFKKMSIQDAKMPKIVKGSEDVLNLLGERVDQLISLDIPSRNVSHMLYRFARDKHSEPLAMAAAQLLKDNIKPGDYVLIGTGWPDRPHVNPDIAETDGPPGAAVLARALHIGLGAVPIVLIEEHLVSRMEIVLEATGMRVISPEEALEAYHYHAAIHAGSVIGFPSDFSLAEKKAKNLIKQFKPSAVISVEKGGMNNKNEIHTSRGAETTKWMAKVDLLFKEATQHNIATIGIGDGGNEIGMGNIRKNIERHIPYGKTCRCGCGGGIAPANEVDVLVVSSISNWGAYGIAANLAALCEDIDVLHDRELEERLLKRSADARFIDGITGYVDASADGLRWPVHAAFVTLLRETVLQALKSMKGLKSSSCL